MHRPIWARYQFRTYQHYLEGTDEEFSLADVVVAHLWEAFLLAAGESGNPKRGQDESILIDLFDGDTFVETVAVFYKGRMIWEAE